MQKPVKRQRSAAWLSSCDWPHVTASVIGSVTAQKQNQSLAECYGTVEEKLCNLTHFLCCNALHCTSVETGLQSMLSANPSAEERNNFRLDSTGYNALPLPPRLKRHVAAAQHAETIHSAADTHTDAKRHNTFACLATAKVTRCHPQKAATFACLVDIGHPVRFDVGHHVVRC